VFSGLRKLIRRAQYWMGRDRHERELREEMEEHRRLRGAASVASPAFHAEQARAVWIPPGLGSFVQDLRYGARQLRHNRLFTFVSLSGLALAIGLNTAVFSVVDVVFWRPLPVKDAERVIRVMRIGKNDRSGPPFTETELRHYQESGVLEAVSGVAMDDRLTVDWPQAAAPRGIAAFVAPNFFEMLGAQLVAGRMLRPDEAPGAGVLVTESTWRRRLLSRADVIGARLTLDGFPFTIAGVVADQSMAIAGGHADVVLPLRAAELVRLPEAATRLALIGKLMPDTGPDQAQAALGAVAPSSSVPANASPGSPKWRLSASRDIRSCAPWAEAAAPSSRSRAARASSPERGWAVSSPTAA
jgi:hypothetical protein